MLGPLKISHLLYLYNRLAQKFTRHQYIIYRCYMNRRHMPQYSRPSSVLHSNIQRFCHTCRSDVRHMVRVSSQIFGRHIASYMSQPQDSARQTRCFPLLYRLVCSRPQEKLQRAWRGQTVVNHKNECSQR